MQNMSDQFNHIYLFFFVSAAVQNLSFMQHLYKLDINHRLYLN